MLQRACQQNDRRVEAGARARLAALWASVVERFEALLASQRSSRVKFQTQLRLARAVRIHGPELDALEQLLFHCVWDGMRLLRQGLGGNDLFCRWLRQQQLERHRLYLAGVEATGFVGLLDVLRRFSCVFAAFLGRRLATPVACACGSLSRLRLHDAKHHAVLDAADVGCGRSDAGSDSGGPLPLSSSSASSDAGPLGAESESDGSVIDGGERDGECDSSDDFASVSGADSSVASTSGSSVQFGWANKCLQKALVRLCDGKLRRYALEYFRSTCANDSGGGLGECIVERAGFLFVLAFLYVSQLFVWVYDPEACAVGEAWRQQQSASKTCRAPLRRNSRQQTA